MEEMLSDRNRPEWHLDKSSFVAGSNGITITINITHSCLVGTPLTATTPKPQQEGQGNRIETTIWCNSYTLNNSSGLSGIIYISSNKGQWFHTIVFLQKTFPLSKTTEKHLTKSIILRLNLFLFLIYAVLNLVMV